MTEDPDDLYLSQLLQGSKKNPCNRGTTTTTTNDQPTEEHLRFLSKTFGHRQFRPMQWKIISSILYQKRDNLAIMTTGYGKSLCYQFPAAFTNGITIVISPLISLMEDQIISLTISNVPACLLGSAQSHSKETIDDILQNKYRVIYLTPEYCTGDTGIELLGKMIRKLNITLIAVDEAHCVTTWGHDFRYSYRKLSILKNTFPNIPILAVTATATPKAKSDIIRVLHLKNPQVLCTGYDRPNLYFSAFPKDEMFKDLKSFMVQKDCKWVFPGSTIVYCLTQQQTKEISEVLNCHNVSCVQYHAGMSLKQRKKAHEDFVKDKVSVIAATIAFGMGIDKPDVRLIIHYGASSSIEGYYQEVGRAGRDGMPAKCVAFWGKKDFITHAFLRKELSADNQSRKADMAELMREYLTTTQCRRHFILSHFEDNENVEITCPKKCCDNCDQKDVKIDKQKYEGVDEDGTYDFTEDAVTFLSAVGAIEGRFGMEKYILFIKGSKSAKIYDSWKSHRLHGSGAHKSDTWWKEIANLMLQEKLLERKMNTGQFSFSSFHVSKLGKKFLCNAQNGEKLVRKPTKPILEMLKKPDLPTTSGWMAVGSSKTVDIGSFRSKSEPELRLNSEEKTKLLKIYHMLLAKRTELAQQHDAMPFTIASNAALMEIAKNKPDTLDALRKLQADGLNEAKIVKFGPEFLNIVRNNSSPKNENVRSLDTIHQILQRYPLENAKMPPSAVTTLTLYKSGHTIEEIMNTRKLAKSTVTGHLADAMKCGYPITLSSLGVTNEVLQIIVDVVNKQDTGYTILTPIKLLCPDHITYDQIKAVCVYLQIRDHLKNLGVSYKDFEDYSYDERELSQDQLKNDDITDDFKLDDGLDDDLLAACDNSVQSTKKNFEKNGTKSTAESFTDDFEFDDDQNDFLLAVCDEMEKSFEKEDTKVANINQTDEPSSKRAKSELHTFLEVTKKGESTGNTGISDQSATKKSAVSKKLPPWLSKKRVA